MPKQRLVFILISLFLFSCTSKQEKNVIAQKSMQTAQVVKPCIDSLPNTFLDIPVDGFWVREKEAGRRDNLQRIFKTLKLDKHQLAQFLSETKDYADLSNIKPRQKYFTITKETDSSSVLHYLVFKLSDFEYVIANCTDTTKVPVQNVEIAAQIAKKKKKSKKIKEVLYKPLHLTFYEKKIDTVEIRFAAVIQKSAAKTLKENKIDYKVLEQINKAYDSKFDLKKLRKGDTLQFIYNQLSVNGKFLDNGHVEAVCCKTKKRAYYAVDYFITDDSSFQYTDEHGKYLKKSFLKSPISKGGSIVSRYNLNRFHPILKVEKAHLGTDFAAPTGTPIIATSSGVVIACEFRQNNGNYVKIKHDSKYETQYLHMSRFARGIRNGVRVQQGQVIGYVGSTGLATGPHVCYRFWKCGQQVDPLKEKLNTIKQISKQEMSHYVQFFASIKSILDKIRLV